MCDEIFSESDSDALIGAIGAGITVFATAHGASADEVLKRKNIKRLVELGMFKTIVTVTREGSLFGYIKETVG